MDRIEKKKLKKLKHWKPRVMHGETAQGYNLVQMCFTVCTTMRFKITFPSFDNTMGPGSPGAFGAMKHPCSPVRRINDHLLKLGMDRNIVPPANHVEFSPSDSRTLSLKDVLEDMTLRALMPSCCQVIYFRLLCGKYISREAAIEIDNAYDPDADEQTLDHTSVYDADPDIPNGVVGSYS